MRKITFIAIFCAFAVSAHAESITQNQIIYDTAKGKLVFTHSDHQAAEKSCDVCHVDKKYGRIPNFNKEKAHGMCIPCHTEKGGPTKCDECHEKLK